MPPAVERQVPRATVCLRGLAATLAVLVLSKALAMKQHSCFADGFFIVSVNAMHALSAWLSLRRPPAARQVAVANWAWKVLYGLHVRYIQQSGPQAWQLLFSSRSIYPLGASSACLDFYQMQGLPWWMISTFLGIHAWTMSTCIDMFKEQLGLPSPGVLRITTGMALGMVLGPRLAEMLLTWSQGQHGSRTKAQPAQQTKEKHAKHETGTPAASLAGSCAGMNVALVSPSCSSSSSSTGGIKLHDSAAIKAAGYEQPCHEEHGHAESTAQHPEHTTCRRAAAGSAAPMPGPSGVTPALNSYTGLQAWFTTWKQVQATVCLRGLAATLAVLVLSKALAMKQHSCFADGFFIVSVNAMHALSAWLSLRRPPAARQVAVANWAWKVLYGLHVRYIQQSGPQAWQLLFSSRSIYPLGASSACLDFYQMQGLPWWMISTFLGIHAWTMSTCIDMFKQQLGLPSPGVLRITTGMTLGMVLGPRMAEMLLTWSQRRHGSRTKAQPAQQMKEKHAKHETGTPAASSAGSCAGMDVALVSPSCSSSSTGGIKLHDQAATTAAGYEQTWHEEHGHAESTAQHPEHTTCRRAAAGSAAPMPGHSGVTSALNSYTGLQAWFTTWKQGRKSGAPAIDVWLKRMQGAQYSSRLQGRTQVCLKLQTDMQVSDLPQDLSFQLQAALSGRNCPRHQLLGMAARPGCITFSLDLCLYPSSSGKNTCRAFWQSMLARLAGQEYGTSSDADALKAQEDVASLARALLPVFTPLLTASQGVRIPICIVAGSTVFSGQWNTDSSAWQLQRGFMSGRASEGALDCSSGRTAAAVASSAAAACRRAKTTSGLDPPSTERDPNTLAATSTETAGFCLGVAYQVDVSKSACEGHSTCVNCAVANDMSTNPCSCSAPAKVMHHMKAHVELLHLSDGMIGQDMQSVQGWQPPSDGQHENPMAAAEDGTGKVPLQLLVRCEGGYLATSMQALDSKMLQVEFAVPDSLLPRRHVGGSPVGMLPVTLELWQGPLHCISSTSLLLQVYHAPRSGVWWWGSHGRTALLATSQLQAAARLLSQSATPTAQLVGWKAFLTDLHIWLTHIRRYAAHSSVGIGAVWIPQAVPATGHPASLQPQELRALGEDLRAYARAAGLQHVLQMIQQQAALVRVAAVAAMAHAAHCKPLPETGAAAQKQQQQAALPMTCVPVCGQGCLLHEAGRHTHSYSKLAAAGPYISMAFAAVASIAVKYGFVAHDHYLVLAMLPWAVYHLLRLGLVPCKDRAEKHSHTAIVSVCTATP